MTMLVKEKKGDEHPDGWNMNKWKHADELLEYLTDETNRYAHDFFQVNKDKLRSSSDFKKWPENGISSGKMRAFLVLTFYFSIMKKDLLKS